ncbi:DUF1304 domain-containing protein [Candidatus Pantoea multigeneris]|uniref:DUF1304 domain-containing protein n=1 Tax=Candidatus Pantoea multigeneris TaxID=2608357 RepID=A0ABX0RA55_9GAMM|nr:DUF1304 domain-containing protein [Pantoea multigeneris]NIF21649.1 DUF1304 domain-containing protein [Pantoea multigeneris]
MLSTLLVVLVAAIHVYILILEMFLWDTPFGRKAFNLSPVFSRDTKVLAANQGLYNGFLAAGLLFGVWLGSEGLQFKLFFLICVMVAGIYGAVTSSRKILYVQTIPALLATIALLYT